MVVCVTLVCIGGAWGCHSHLDLVSIPHKSRRGILDVADFTDTGLNRALPLAKNQHWMPSNKTLYQEWLKETGQEDH